MGKKCISGHQQALERAGAHLSEQVVMWNSREQGDAPSPTALVNKQSNTSGFSSLSVQGKCLCC